MVEATKYSATEEMSIMIRMNDKYVFMGLVVEWMVRIISIFESSRTSSVIMLPESSHAELANLLIVLELCLKIIKSSKAILFTGYDPIIYLLYC